MKRRFGIAQALLNDPKILIIDEPTADLTQKKDYAFTIFFLNWQWKELFYYLRI